jgi:hypothetical protein
MSVFNRALTFMRHWRDGGQLRDGTTKARCPGRQRSARLFNISLPGEQLEPRTMLAGVYFDLTANYGGENEVRSVGTHAAGDTTEIRGTLREVRFGLQSTYTNAFAFKSTWQ